MKTVSLEFAQKLINFGQGEVSFADRQLRGAVAAYNMIARNRVAYLADEVGLGKTYVALGVWGLLRYLNPAARIMIIAPRENIQRKWEKELRNFVRANWLAEDNCVKGLDGHPVHEPLVVGSVHEFAAAAQVSDNRDPILRMTSFSIAARQAESRQRLKKRLQPLVPWIDRIVLSPKNPYEFRDAYGRVLNALVPDIDLLIIDEAHNLRHGFGPTVSNRNRVLGLALGHPDGASPECHWYGHRPRAVLLLSATPFEYDYADIHRQFDVLGFGNIKLRDAGGGDPLSIRRLLDPDLGDDEKKRTAGRVLIRQIGHLTMGGKQYTKNMYRREWRRGGFAKHDHPMEFTDARQRLVVGLMQKKVAEVLGDERFNNSYQIGMLSSFESFLESMARKRHKQVIDEENEDGERVFDGDQDATAIERQGIDTFALESIVMSYRKEFGKSLPHPKLDATADALATAFETGEKTLVFVRRVATVKELKAKLDQIFDEWIRGRMLEMLPELDEEIEELFVRYQEESRPGRAPDVSPPSDHETQDQVEEDLLLPVEDDTGGTDTFFAWFFRGQGPSGVLSGAAFQKNRLTSMGSVYSTVFEDDYVAWLLGRPDDPLAALADTVGQALEQLAAELRRRAYRHYCHRTAQRERYPRFFVFESYQVAGLELLSQMDGEVGGHAQYVLAHRFAPSGEGSQEAPESFPGPEGSIGLVSFFTGLVKRPALRGRIWPDDKDAAFEDRFVTRERRRELLSAMARLGASYIDLYLVAIQSLGGFDTRVQVEQADQKLAEDFLDLLERQTDTPGFHAFYELSSAAEAFGTLLSVNYPEVHSAELSDLAEIFGRSLQHQLPVGGMSGSVNKRLVRQFRMPGFPLVMATTSVLQEGEDLHTFCKDVIHYGITWTPSAMEQRTGRVDRIGGLIQRRLDGRNEAAEVQELIQVYIPHLADTVEVFQVQRVLKRLNEFLKMIHRVRPESGKDQTRINIADEILKAHDYVPQLTEPLESAFPVTDDWLTGELDPAAISCPDIKSLEGLLETKWRWLVGRLGLEEHRSWSPRKRAATATVVNGKVVDPRTLSSSSEPRRQPFRLELVSQVAGDATLIKCASPVGNLDLDDPRTLDQLYDLQRNLGMVKVCVRHDHRKRAYAVTIEGYRLFHLSTTQPEEIERLVRRTVRSADTIERIMLEGDADPLEWHHGTGADDE